MEAANDFCSRNVLPTLQAVICDEDSEKLQQVLNYFKRQRFSCDCECIGVRFASFYTLIRLISSRRLQDVEVYNLLKFRL